MKFLASGLVDRLEREAHAISALNHPNICTLFDVGKDYLVMEYIDGQPLKGPLQIEVALPYAIEIADAVEAAHHLGIVHRDLKPANILIAKFGIKLLDFGLAEKPLAISAAAGETETMPLTPEGVIVGTPQYMSPEQVEGKSIDLRSDIFSFGVVYTK